MWGIVRAKPKFVPDVMSIRLLGPGVIEDTKAKATSAVKSSAVNIPQDCADLRGMCLRSRPLQSHFHK
jgi:hypothetical protein